jgi:hypothetical protein
MMLHDNFKTIGYASNVRWWGKEDFVIHHNTNGIPDSLNPTELQDAANDILAYVRDCSGVEILFIRDDSVDIYNKDDGVLALGWTGDIGSNVGMSTNQPALIGGKQTFTDSKIRINKDAPHFKAKDAFWTAVETIVHEIIHTYSGGHTWTLPWSIMAAGGIGTIVNSGRLIPHAFDLFYLNWLKRRKMEDDIDFVADHINLYPFLTRAKGTKAHHDLHLPCVRYKGKAYAALLNRTSKTHYSLKEWIPYAEFFTNTGDYTFKNYVTVVDGEIDLPTIVVMNKPNHKGKIGKDKKGYKILEFAPI